MTLPTLIDVAIGLVLMFFILATLGSVLAEMWAAYKKWRHKLLRETVTQLLEPESARKFWKHALIRPLYGTEPEDKQGNAKAKRSFGDKAVQAIFYVPKKVAKVTLPSKAHAPAYLESKLFATIVLDIATGEGASGRLPSTPGAWEYAITEHVPAEPGENNDLQDRLLAMLRQVPRDAADYGASMHALVAEWYDEAMKGASSAYRKKLQMALFILGCFLAVSLNCDAIRIAMILYQNPALREQVVQQAKVVTEDKKVAEEGNAGESDNSTTEGAKATDDLRENLKQDLSQLRDLTKIGFPIGWQPTWRDNFVALGDPAQKPKPGPVAYLAKIAGLLVSALAVCLGAPFWFDLLGRLVKLRSSAGADAEKKPAGKSVESGGSAPVATGSPAGGPPSAPGAATAMAPAAPVPLPSAVEALTNPTTKLDVARAYWLAEFADHAYETNSFALEQWLKQNGFTLVLPVDKNGTQGFLAQAEGAAVLAFRGTEKKLEDWVTDAKFGWDKNPEPVAPGRIHVGFADALRSVLGDLDVPIRKLKDHRVLLHFTGHSLGAALATLAAVHYGKDSSSCPIHSVHTFGSPRVGDAEFAGEFDKLFGGRAYRFVNNEDLVTRVPARAQDYKHVNELVYIDDRGQLQRDIGYWFRFLNFVTNAVGDLKEAVKTTVKDHSMKLYCGHLLKAAGKTSNP